MAEQYLETKENVQAPDDLESKRESLSILASLGTTKEFLGVEMSLGDIKKLQNKDDAKFYLRYQTILGKQLSSSLADSTVLAASKAASKVVSTDDTEQLYQDLKSDVFGQKWFYSDKVVKFGQKWLYSGKVVVFRQ